MFDRPTGFRTAIHREKHALLYILDRYCTHATDKEEIIYNIYIYKYNIHTCTNRLYAVLTDQFSFRTAFDQNARGQFSTFIVVLGRYNTSGYFKIWNPTQPPSVILLSVFVEEKPSKNIVICDRKSISRRGVEVNNK